MKSLSNSSHSVDIKADESYRLEYHKLEVLHLNLPNMMQFVHQWALEVLVVRLCQLWTEVNQLFPRVYSFQTPTICSFIFTVQRKHQTIPSEIQPMICYLSTHSFPSFTDPCFRFVSLGADGWLKCDTTPIGFVHVQKKKGSLSNLAV